MPRVTAPPRTPLGIGWPTWVVIVAVLLIIAAAAVMYVQ